MATPPWTDVQVATLNHAHWMMRLGDHGYPGLEHLQSHRRTYINAVQRYGEATQGPADLPRARRQLQKVARLILISSLEAPTPPTTTPEDTLREAGISSKRQAKYQRRMSSLLAGRT